MFEYRFSVGDILVSLLNIAFSITVLLGFPKGFAKENIYDFLFVDGSGNDFFCQSDIWGYGKIPFIQVLRNHINIVRTCVRYFIQNLIILM